VIYLWLNIIKEMDDKIVKIQATWRGYILRKRLKIANNSLSIFHKKYRLKKEAEKGRKSKIRIEDDLKFYLLLEHRKKQRQQKIDMMQIIEILPPFQIKAFFEKQKQESATKIQAFYRGYMERKLFVIKKEKLIQEKAATLIQRAVILVFNFNRRYGNRAFIKG
jgi:hypothetical protein